MSLTFMHFIIDEPNNFIYYTLIFCVFVISKNLNFTIS